MKDLYAFMGEHPIVTVLVVWTIGSVLKMPFWALNRYFRSRNIRAHGWPKPPLDADGDVVHPDDRKEAA